MLKLASIGRLCKCTFSYACRIVAYVCPKSGTSVPRQFAEEINAFLEKHHISKVKLIEAGFNALMDEVAESDLGLAKIMDGYDDFFETEKK